MLKIIVLTHPYTPIISSAVPALISDNFKKAPKQNPQKLWIPFFHNDTFSIPCYEKSISEKCM